MSMMDCKDEEYDDQRQIHPGDSILARVLAGQSISSPTEAPCPTNSRTREQADVELMR